MSSETIFQIDLVLGYVAWLLCFGAYVLPKLLAMDRVEAHRAMQPFIASGSLGSFSSFQA